MADTIDKNELKQDVGELSRLFAQRDELKAQLKEVTAQIKELEARPIDYLVMSGKDGFTIDGGDAEIRLKKRVAKKSVNKKLAAERLPELYTSWRTDNILVGDANMELLATKTVEALWSDLEKPDGTSYWLEKKLSKKRKRELAEPPADVLDQANS